jgi:predicted ester cyclase
MGQGIVSRRITLTYMTNGELENRRLVAKLYEEGWGRGAISVVDEVFAPRHVLHWNEGVASLQQRTADEVKSIIRSYREAFPDLEVTIDNMVAERDKVAVQVTFVGTHRGVYEGFPPTRKKSRFTDMQILRFEDGKIVESFLGSGGLKYFYSILDGSAFT